MRKAKTIKAAAVQDPEMSSAIEPGENVAEIERNIKSPDLQGQLLKRAKRQELRQSFDTFPRAANIDWQHDRSNIIQKLCNL